MSTIENCNLRGMQTLSNTFTWSNMLPDGEITILAAAPGTGKTTLACAIAAGVTKGQIGEEYCQAGAVIFWTAEDCYQRTIGPRLSAAGAQLDLVYNLNEYEEKRSLLQGEAITNPKERQTLIESFDLEGDLPALVVIDPVTELVQGQSNSNEDVRKALVGCLELARAFSCPVLVLSHLAKGSEGRPMLERIKGSGAFGEKPRCALSLEQTEKGRDPCSYRHQIERGSVSIRP